MKISLHTLFTLSLCLTVALFSSFVLPDIAAADKDIKIFSLPAPEKTGGKPLMEALNERKTNRNISSNKISDQELSNLLWAVWGINRSDGKRTAPTAMNRQSIEVYVVLESGVWLYDAKKNELVLAIAGDERSKFSNTAVTLLYTAPANDKFSAMHIGSLYQNAGLYCASAGLANVVKASGIDALKDILKLPKGYEVFIIQSIGYPK